MKKEQPCKEQPRPDPYIRIGKGAPRGKGESIFSLDILGRDDLRYTDLKATDSINSAADKWRLLPAFLKTKGLVKQHVDSFDYFVQTEMKSIIKANHIVRSEVDPNFSMRVLDIHVGEPLIYDNHSQGRAMPLYPQECRLRDLTYAAPMTVDVVYNRGGTFIQKKGVHLGYMPIMLRSGQCNLSSLSPQGMADHGECPLDPGGYFIVHGTEKVILIQEQLSKNRIIVEQTRDGEITASVTSSTAERKSKTNISCVKGGKVVMRHNTFKSDVPVGILFKAMGVTSDLEAAELVCGRDKKLLDLLGPTLEACVRENVNTQREALEWLGGRCKPPMRMHSSRRPMWQEAREYLATLVLSHISCDGPPVPGTKNKDVPLISMRAKAVYMGLMIRRVLEAIQKGGVVDDRDFVGNKRLELAGSMMSLLFEDLFKSFLRSLQRQIDDNLQKRNKTAAFDPAKAITQCSRNITEGLSRALSSGNWIITRFNMRRAGVTHVLSRLSYISALGMMSRMTSQFEKTRKVSGPRSLQTSQWGMICPSDTPEGEGCGLIKNLAFLAHVTTDFQDAPLRKLLYSIGVEDITFFSGADIYDSPDHYLVFINGELIGVHRQPLFFVNFLRERRRDGTLGPFVSIYKSVEQKSVFVSSDGGRVCRPLIIVDSSGTPLVGAKEIEEIIRGFKSFQDLAHDGKIEYLDVNEETDALIAVTESEILKPLSPGSAGSMENCFSTHLEIEPFTVLGAVAGLIPYPHHNQSPRNTYQCAMGKQAIGAIGYNQLRRIDTLLYLLVYPQQPLVKTKTIELIGYDKLPAGQNAMVAVMSFSGYDIEDALILNKASVDRGFGRCQVLRKYVSMIRQYPNSMFDQLVKGNASSPLMTESDRAKEKLGIIDSDGLASVGARVYNGQVLINKKSPIETVLRSAAMVDAASLGYKPADLKYKKPGDGVVDQLILTTNQEDQTIIKVNVRETRRPELGDKFSSRHGQKGVCGLIVGQEDMPFNDYGVTPDIIMNPHGFPSRMTVGKMIELLAGKAGLAAGKLQYGTAFGGSKVEDMSRILINNGFSYSGKDYLTSGITGESLKAYIFFGPVYYQKLKHMVMDKMHARAQGPRAILTRQPTEGRSRDGGLRVGEMERDCLIGHGASSLLLERLLFSSDQFHMNVCQKCGLIGWQGYCGFCKKRQGVVNVSVPYAAKLLFQELISMNIVPRLQVGDWETFNR